MSIRQWKLLAALALMIGGAGCALDVDFPAGSFVCQVSADCPAGQVCADGYCAIPSPAGADAAPGASAAADAAPENGVETLVFLPIADGYVDSVAPTVNHGSSAELRVDGDPEVASYLRFESDQLEHIEERVTVESARLELFANSSQGSGYRVWVVEEAPWSEEALTFSNAPPMGLPLSSSGAVAAGTWTSVDLAAALDEGDLRQFALTTDEPTTLSLASRETGDLSPRLVITTAGP